MRKAYRCDCMFPMALAFYPTVSHTSDRPPASVGGFSATSCLAAPAPRLALRVQPDRRLRIPTHAPSWARPCSFPTQEDAERVRSNLARAQPDCALSVRFRDVSSVSDVRGPLHLLLSSAKCDLSPDSGLATRQR